MNKTNIPAREWTLCHGEYEDPAWNGPEFDGHIVVIEKSAFAELEKENESLQITLDQQYAEKNRSCDTKRRTRIKY